MKSCGQCGSFFIPSSNAAKCCSTACKSERRNSARRIAAPVSPPSDLLLTSVESTVYPSASYFIPLEADFCIFTDNSGSSSRVLLTDLPSDLPLHMTAVQMSLPVVINDMSACFIAYGTVWGYVSAVALAGKILQSQHVSLTHQPAQFQLPSIPKNITTKRRRPSSSQPSTKTSRSIKQSRSTSSSSESTTLVREEVDGSKTTLTKASSHDITLEFTAVSELEVRFTQDFAVLRTGSSTDILMKSTMSQNIYDVRKARVTHTASFDAMHRKGDVSELLSPLIHEDLLGICCSLSEILETRRSFRTSVFDDIVKSKIICQKLCTPVSHVGCTIRGCVGDAVETFTCVSFDTLSKTAEVHISFMHLTESGIISRDITHTMANIDAFFLKWAFPEDKALLGLLYSETSEQIKFEVKKSRSANRERKAREIYGLSAALACAVVEGN